MKIKTINVLRTLAFTVLAFALGHATAERCRHVPRGTVFECSSDRLVGTLFTDQEALDVPGRLVLAWNAEGNKKLIDRGLFEVCAVVLSGKN